MLGDGDGIGVGSEGMLQKRVAGDAVDGGAALGLRVKLVASAVVLPVAMAVCPRGMVRVWMMLPVAGSHSQ